MMVSPTYGRVRTACSNSSSLVLVVIGYTVPFACYNIEPVHWPTSNTRVVKDEINVPIALSAFRDNNTHWHTHTHLLSPPTWLKNFHTTTRAQHTHLLSPPIPGKPPHHYSTTQHNTTHPPTHTHFFSLWTAGRASCPVSFLSTADICFKSLFKTRTKKQNPSHFSHTFLKFLTTTTPRIWKQTLRVPPDKTPHPTHSTQSSKLSPVSHFKNAEPDIPP